MMRLKDQTSSNKASDTSNFIPEKLENFLRYAYSDALTIRSVEDAITTAYNSRKFALPSVLEQCVSYLESNVSVANVLRIYEFATRTIDAPLLTFACLRMIDVEASEVLKTKAFSRIHPNTAELVAKRSHLNLDSEYVLYEALIRWAEAECKRRRMDPDDSDNMRLLMRKVLPNIRFMSMTAEEFARNPAKNGLLSVDQCNCVFMNLAIPGCVPLLPGINPTRMKRPASPDYFVCSRYVGSNYAPIQRPVRVFGVQFRPTNKNVYVIGASVPVRLDNTYCTLTSPKYSGRLRLIREALDKSVECREFDVLFQFSKGRDAVVGVSKPYRVKAGEKCEVELVFHSTIDRGVVVPLSRKKRKREVAEDVVFEFEPFVRDRLSNSLDIVELTELHFYC